MRIDILTLFPEMFEGPFNESILRRSQENGFVEIVFHDIRDYSQDKHKKVDDYAFGGGAGMVMQIEPIALLLDKLKSERSYDEIIYMTPDGDRFSQTIANQVSLLNNIIVLCGHYKGVDQRVRDYYVTREISIGDFVLTGGELAAAVVVDAVVRLIPGVISDETSALTDSFQDNLLAPPVYTRPADFRGWKVPDVLLSGHQAKIDQWREEQAWQRTKKLRPDLLDEK
ncbi:tRNA (guanosine(37)-N1)-methyltransferase TrmD [Alkalitalea saponilacus]|uniref:tRNA (guanine-N(1)-)-methyltransferase n=1 Tax=Alkalitalea saponilacus TaxID=889453 RepID=A0A1T5HSB7_9BACT|nr:tRNA (guanosine(37)-N1)-methyltransferase TrmD [Alkalitalea saponilacus]ASB50064.1 tRNA (guanosine(37)-N1)-methyltransferase TrmD [Alkalitalea saponilacus]SKC23420.1 tRNA (guanine37-N1)-methyltransferase [Alkalitalea saponilacus]